MLEIGKSNTKKKEEYVAAAAASTKIEVVGDNFKAVNPDEVNETSFVPSSYIASSILLQNDAHHNFIDSIKPHSILTNYIFGLKIYMQHFKLV